MAMVYMGGHVSGAHYNPAVSFGLLLRGVIPASTMVAYWAAQLMAGALAFAFGYLVVGNSPGIHPGAGVYWYSALAAEVVFTTALVLVVLNVAATKQTAGNSFYGLAIGATVAAGAFVVARSPARLSTRLSEWGRRSCQPCSRTAAGPTCGSTSPDRSPAPLSRRRSTAPRLFARPCHRSNRRVSRRFPERGRRRPRPRLSPTASR